MREATMLSPTTRETIERALRRYPQARSAILPALWAVQEQFGYIPTEAMPEVAALLGLEASEIKAVASFYSMYLSRPAGRHQIAVCINVACALRGAEDIVAHLERRLGCPSGGTTADGAVTWQATIECLGACGYAPMMQVDHRFYEHLTPEKVDAILERIAAEPAPWEAPAGATAPAGHDAAPEPTASDGPVASPESTAAGPRRRGRGARSRRRSDTAST